MHRRKQFLIYPPNYKPGDGYKVRYSKRQAWKVAVRMGVGASVDVSVHIHPGRCEGWISSSGYGLWGPLFIANNAPSSADAKRSAGMKG